MTTDNLGMTVRTLKSTAEGIGLEYTLFRSVKKINGRYSYSVVLNQYSGGENECVFAADISRKKHRAIEIFSSLSAGQVTACTFFEVLEEIL